MYFSKRKTFRKEMSRQQEILNHLINTQEEERVRISRNLHDAVSSKLAAISMYVYLLGQTDYKPEERKEMAEDTFDACQQLIERTREISHELIPPVLDNMGLDVAIKELCQQFSKSDNVTILYENLQAQSFFSNLNKGQEIHLFRIIEELVDNSLKHGKASEIEIAFTDADNAKTMIYTDNGRGISSNQLSQSKGTGLYHIFVRSGILQAKVHIDLHYNKGFYFTLIS